MIQFVIPCPKNKRERKHWRSTNSIYAGGGRAYYERKADADYWHGLVFAMLVGARIPRKQFAVPVNITFEWGTPKLDIDNYSYMGKMIVDGLKGYLLTDDDRKHVVSVLHRYGDVDGVRVTITEIENEQS